VDRVRAAEVPVLADALLRGHGRHVVAQERRHAPRLRDVPVEAVRLVLREHDDVQVVRVHEVGQREVHQSVDAPERHRGLGSRGGERHEALALAPGEDDGEDSGCGGHAQTVAPRGGTTQPGPASWSRRVARRPSRRPPGRPGRRRAGGSASVWRVRVDLLTREYPPHVYGGAGVHVAELSAVLRRHVDVRVRCFDGPRGEEGVTGYSVPGVLSGANAALGTFGVDLQMADDVAGADLVHSHTWYANLGGHLAGLLHGVPHVLSAHSLEPLRPWKAEQLGGGYALSSWAERTAYEGAAGIIAVSSGMRDDILRVYPQVDPEKV